MARQRGARWVDGASRPRTGRGRGVRAVNPPRILIAATAVCAVAPLGALGLHRIIGGGARLPPAVDFFVLWPPFLLAWAWEALGWAGMAYVEVVTYFLVCAAGLLLARTTATDAALAAIAAMFVLPLVGVFRRSWGVSLLGAALALGFSLFWTADPPAGPLRAASAGVGYVYAVLLSLVGALDCVASHLLAQREQQLVAERGRAEEQERLFRLLADNSGDVISLHALDGAILYISPACETHLGHAPRDLIGRLPYDLCHPDDVPPLRSGIGAAASGQTARVSCRLRTKAGTYLWYEVETRPVLGAGGRPVQVQSAARDVNLRKAFEEQLAHQAFHDALTGLPNRALFHERVRHALARSGTRGQGLAVLFIDLDNFKRVNDSLGHNAGDELLGALGRRLQGVVRSVDTVARLGGDEFAVLLERVRGDGEPTELAERIATALRAPITVGGLPLHVTASVGIVTTNSPQTSADELLRDADTAMYAAKGHGKAQHRVFERSLNAQLPERLQLEEELRAALERGELRLHYQPIVRLDGGGVAGFEALLRWMHPRLGLVGPGEFIPAAEDSGLILAVGRWVLEEACRQGRTWQQRHRRQPPLFMSVNVSVRQLQSPGFAAEVDAVVGSTGVDPSTIQLEITESVLLDDAPAMRGLLAGFRERGFRLAIDDFGTGYSSMGYLQHFPVDTLKIDRRFVERLGQGPEDTAIVRSLVSLARELHIGVSGEGIETADQWARLRAQHCEHGQGFYFAKPLPPDDAERYLAGRGGPADDAALRGDGGHRR